MPCERSEILHACGIYQNTSERLCRRGGDKELQFFVKVPVGVQELRVAADSNVKRIAASHGNWQSSESLQKYELEVNFLSSESVAALLLGAYLVKTSCLPCLSCTVALHVAWASQAGV